MAYGKIDARFWEDPQVRGLSERARLFMLYLLTSRHKNRLGCYVLDPFYAAADLQWPVEQARACLAELVASKRVQYDEAHRIVLIPRFLKYNALENHKVVTGAQVELAGLPDTPLLAGLLKALQKHHRPHYRPLEEAVRARLSPNGDGPAGNDKANGIEVPANQEHGNGIANDTPNDKAYRGTDPSVSVAVSVAVPGAVTDADESSVVVSPNPPHVREDSAPPPSRPPHDDDRHDDDGEAAAQDEMRTDLVAEIGNDPDASRRRSWHASAESLITGDDPTIWRDPRGDGGPIPWPERPRLLRLAVQRTIAEGARPTELRSKLRYVIQQQLDPLPPRAPAAGSEHAAVRARGEEKPQGPKAGRSGSGWVGAPPPKDEILEDMTILTWAKENPEEADEMRSRIATGLAADGEWRGAHPAIVEAKARQLFRQQVLDRIGLEASA